MEHRFPMSDVGWPVLILPVALCGGEVPAAPAHTAPPVLFPLLRKVFVATANASHRPECVTSSNLLSVHELSEVGTVIPSSHPRRTEGPERWNLLPDVTQLGRGQGGVQWQAAWALNIMLKSEQHSGRQRPTF